MLGATEVAQHVKVIFFVYYIYTFIILFSECMKHGSILLFMNVFIIIIYLLLFFYLLSFYLSFFLSFLLSFFSPPPPLLFQIE